ncbi:MAG: hypothetical protein MJ010_04270 [Paludibacteraceae bacterium]|nr:hypothetical protein [Paludibacteraceae bacterium]
MKKLKLLKNLRHRLGWMLCLVAFLAIGQSAWAEYGIWEDDAYDIKLNNAWIFNTGAKGSDTNCNVYIAIGASSITWTDLYVNTWCNDNWEHRYLFVYYRVSSDHSGEFTKTVYDSGSSHKNVDHKYVKSGLDIDILALASEKSIDGDFYFDYYFGIDNNGTEPYRYAPGGDGYYSMEFKTSCEGTTPSEVLDGTNIMFYVEGQWNDESGKSRGITNGTKSCIGEGTTVANKRYAINVAKTEIPENVYVTNNCSGWEGNGPISKDKISAGGYYVYEYKNRTDPTTLSTFSPSKSSMAAGESISISLTGSKSNSSYGAPLYAIIYVKNSSGEFTRKECINVKTSSQTISDFGSDLAEGTYKVQSVLADGRIYYLDKSFDLEVTASCTPPTAGTITGNNTMCGSGTLTLKDYKADGTSLQWYKNGAEISGATSSTYNVTESGTYTVKVSLTATPACSATTEGFEVTVSPATVAGTISGTTSFCQGQSTTLTLTGYTGTLKWQESATEAGEYTDIDGATNSTYQASKAAWYRVNVKSGVCEAQNTASVNVTQSDLPAKPGSISGNISPCKGATETYSVAQVTGANSYIWTVPTDWEITAGENTSSITVTVGEKAGEVKVKAHNDCGDSAESATTGTITPQGESLSVTPASINAKAYEAVTISAVSSRNVTWTVASEGTDDIYLLNASDNSVYKAGTATKRVVVKAAGSGTVTAKIGNGGCSQREIPVTITTEQDECGSN